MGLAGVSSPVLLTQVARLEEFQRGVEGFRPEMDELCRVAEQCGGGGEGSSHDNDRAKVLAGLMEGYERLKSLGASRGSVLGNFRPQVQLYESSHDAWARLLKGWRERAATLPSPSCMPNVIQKLLAETKVCMCVVSVCVVGVSEYVCMCVCVWVYGRQRMWWGLVDWFQTDLCNNIGFNFLFWVPAFQVLICYMYF